VSPHTSGLDLEVYADEHTEWLEEIRAEQHQALEDEAEHLAWAAWADREAERLEDASEKRRHIIKLEWPISRGGDVA
jgi:hypothetical protein